jgi:homoserine O-succinyltransferase/O-acetyltransferase
MSLVRTKARSGSAADARGGNGLTIGLVNNMPDPAFHATERQFLDLIRATRPGVNLRFKLFAIPEMPRGGSLRNALAAHYHGIAELWDMPLDGLIVTGTEPRADKLVEEPYWPAMAKLVDWARANTRSTIWSCLAAHAAVLHADGIERRPVAEKKFGVFACEAAAHPLTAGVTPLTVPHSRYNDLPAAALAASGYDLLAQSEAAGVDTFARTERDGSLFVFFQGHPEYEADSLLREYRRDIARYLRGEREHYPAPPQNYFTKDAMTLLNIFRARAAADRRADLIAEFPFAALETGLEVTWRRSAVGLYRNWIEYLKDRKAQRSRSAASSRRVHRDAQSGERARADITVGG